MNKPRLNRIALGSALPVLIRHVDQDTIDAYAAASGDFNPIHVDPEFARNGPFGRTIAHGLMTLAYVSELLNLWTAGGFDGAGELDVTFIGPVFAGDEVCVTGTVEDIVPRDDGPCLRVRLSVTAAGRPILAGIALYPNTNPGQ
jgi:3-hydroxybutyryl-CoA dehydratase